ncbi:MAG TPA: RcnB family protein [Rhodanobacter sp.]|jgi:Ni/Co efflux regulator RcnB
MKILHSLFVAALLLGTSSYALAGPTPGDHDRRGQYSSHNDHRRGGDRDRHTRDSRDHRRYDHRRYDHRRYNNRPVVVYRHNSRPYGYGHRHWRRGYRYAGPTYVVHDYGYYRLRHPPRGYRWVRADNNDFLLVAIATGIILDIALR